VRSDALGRSQVYDLSFNLNCYGLRVLSVGWGAEGDTVECLIRRRGEERCVEESMVCPSASLFVGL